MEQSKKHQLETTDQQLFTDSFNCCWELLKKKEYYISGRETNIFSKLSLNYGHDMYEAMVIFMTEIIKSNNDKVAVENSKVGSIKIVTTEATRNIGYDDNCDHLDQQQQQQQQQVDKVNIYINNSQEKMITKKRKISVDEINSKKMFKADNKKNNCDDVSNAQNIQIASSDENLVEKLHMIDFIEKEEKLFTEQSITIKDEMLPVTDDSIDVDEIDNSHDHSIGLKRKSNEVSNSFNNNNQSCSNKVIDNVDHQKNTRISTGSLARKKYSVYTEDDELSSTEDENHLDDDDDDYDYDYDDDDDNDNNSRNQNKKRESVIEIIDGISFEEKTRVVKLATENPTWSLDILREQSGCKNIKERRQVGRWKKQVQQGGSGREKMNFVNNWVISKCIENQKKGKVITNEKIITWGLEAKKIFKPTNFSAHASWLHTFKKNHDITGKSYNLHINCNSQRKESFTFSKIFVPHEIKAKVVNLANENPHWSFNMLREQSGCNNLETINQLYRWKKVVKNLNKKRATNPSTEKI